MNKKSLNIKIKPLVITPVAIMFVSQCLISSSFAEESLNSLNFRAHTALEKGQPQRAAELYEKAAGMGESAEAEIGLVRAYLQSGEFRKAISFGNLVAAEHPDISETAALLAYLEDREGQTTPALSKLTEEIKKRPNDVALFGAQAEIMIDRMAIPQAIQQLDEWIGHNPPQGDIYRLRARAALASGNRQELITWRKKAALAYESTGDLDAAKPLQDWLAMEEATQEVSNKEVSITKMGDTKPIPVNKKSSELTNWPTHQMESFPLISGNIMKSGNGFIVDRGRRVMTYASLVSSIKGGVLVRNGLGKIRKARVEKILPDQGLALLRLDTPYAKEWSLPDQAFTTPTDSHFCFAIGFPVTDELEKGYPILAPGLVVRPDVGIGGLMQVTSSLAPDNSGSPVFDSSGKFIGMTLGAKEPLKGITDRATLLGKGIFAVRAENLKKLFPKLSRSTKQSKHAKNLPTKGTPQVEELYEKLLPVVVTIVVPD